MKEFMKTIKWFWVFQKDYNKKFLLGLVFLLINFCDFTIWKRMYRVRTPMKKELKTNIKNYTYKIIVAFSM